MNEEDDLSIFFVAEYDYDFDDDGIVVIANNEDEAKIIAIRDYGMIRVGNIKEMLPDKKGYWTMGYYQEQKMEFYDVK